MFIKCKYCKKKLYRKHNEILYNRKKRKFCNRKCYSKFRIDKHRYIFKKIKFLKCKCNCGLKIKKPYHKFYSCKHYWKWLKNKSYEKKYGIIKSQKIKNKLRNKKIGKKLSESTKEKIGKSHLREKSVNWKGGNSNEPYDINFDEKLKKQVKNIYSNVCQICFKKITNKKRASHCHHINYNKKDSRLINLVLLHHSKECHFKAHKDKDYWFAYFCYLKNIESEVLLWI